MICQAKDRDFQTKNKRMRMFSRDPEIQLVSEIRVELRGILKAATMRRSMWKSQYK